MNHACLRGNALLKWLEDVNNAPVVLASACLLGATCRYDGQSKNSDQRLLQALMRRQSIHCLAYESTVQGLFEAAMTRNDVQDLRVNDLLADLLPRRVIPICPEIFGDLPCPRLPADFFDGDGQDLLKGKARLLNRSGQDVSKAFLKGAMTTLTLARTANATCAILKEGSPSCGVRRVQREGQKIRGEGVTSALLNAENILRWTEEDLMDLTDS